MQSTANTEPEKRKGVVRSVRFRDEQWQAVEAKADQLGVTAGRFIRNAVLAAAGAKTEAQALREQATALESTGVPVVAPAPPKKQKPLAKAKSRR